MIFREATTTDIPQMQVIRNAVKENVLSNPSLVKGNDYIDFLISRGKGWVCIVEDKIVGFAICDLLENNIWALFVHPNFDKRGIGKTLHNIMMDWYFDQQKESSPWRAPQALELPRKRRSVPGDAPVENEACQKCRERSNEYPLCC